MSWKRILCHLAAEYGWTPQQVSEMTLDQIYTYLTSASGDKKMSYGQAREKALEFRSQENQWSAEIMQAVCYGN